MNTTPKILLIITPLLFSTCTPKRKTIQTTYLKTTSKQIRTDSLKIHTYTITTKEYSPSTGNLIHEQTQTITATTQTTHQTDTAQTTKTTHEKITQADTTAIVKRAELTNTISQATKTIGRTIQNTLLTITLIIATLTALYYIRPILSKLKKRSK